MAVGYCKFNEHTAKFEVDEEKTDPYLIKEKNWIGAVHYILLRHFKEDKGYPSVIGYAS